MNVVLECPMTKHLLILLLLCPATTVSAQKLYASEDLKLRAGASVQARVLTTITAGSAVDVRDCDRAGGEWCLVVHNRERGFVEARLLDAAAVKGVTRPLSANGYSKPANERSAARGSASGSSAAPRGYYRGPRGGCYTYSPRGRKRYVDRSLCN